MATILITHGVPGNGFQLLAGHEVLMPAQGDAYSEQELLEMMPRVDAVVACGALTGEMIRRGTRLKIIANYGAGYDRVDQEAARQCGVPLTNLPDAPARPTAELAAGLMLAAARRIGELNLRMRSETPESLFGMGREMGMTLQGRTLGILGLGHIGSRLAEIARALDMKVIGFNRHGGHSEVAELVTMEELLARSDVLSIHCPLTPQTRGFVSRELLASMKQGSMLINTARGAIVDNEALAEAVASGHLAGAGVDVYPDEPHVPACLLAQPRIVLTPHIGTNTAQSREDMAAACSRQVLDALSGQRPANIVNGL